MAKEIIIIAASLFKSFTSYATRITRLARRYSSPMTVGGVFRNVSIVNGSSGSSIFAALILWAGMIILAPESLSAAEDTSKKTDQLNIAVVCVTVVEAPWATALIQSLERIKRERPHGLDINWDISENVLPPDAERVLREYAKTGKYGIIWGHAQYQDAITELHEQYPEILWFGAGAGFTPPFGRNFYFGDILFHEPAYLLGLIAGMMTESNVIGAVASYPYGDINLTVNGYIAGASSVNPDIRVKMIYLDSWFDPPRAKEAALAQIAGGADFIYAERFGPFEACKEKGKLAFGHITDQHSLSPEVVVSSSLGLWDPALRFIIDEWWNHYIGAEPYRAPSEGKFYSMKDGATDIAPYYGLGSIIPREVMEKVNRVREAIKEGRLVVPIDEKMVR